MLDKKYIFISGLPRSGSTLLCNILNQNPKFHATATSGLATLLASIRNEWENIGEFVAAPPPKGTKEEVLKAVFLNFYNKINKPVIFDKSRSWPAYIEMMENILGSNNIKIIAPVRPLVEVIASFEKLYRENAKNWQFPQEKTNFVEWQTIEGRACVMMSANQPIGLAYNRLKDAVDRGHANKILFVLFKHLTEEPEITMRQIYSFIGEDYYNHDFNNVEQVTDEYDEIHGIPGLHTIRPKVEPVKNYALEILGEEVYNMYNKKAFWEGV